MGETKRRTIRRVLFKNGQVKDQIYGSREEAEAAAKKRLEESERGLIEWEIEKVEIWELYTTWTPGRFRSMREVQQGEAG